MIFSAVGFRVLQFDASLLFWMVILFLLNIRPVLRLPARVVYGVVAIIALYIGVFLAKGVQPPYFVAVAIVNSMIVLSNYLDVQNRFYFDFSKLLKIFMWYSLLTIPIMMFGSSLFNQVQLGIADYRTFGYIFWFSPFGGPEAFQGFRAIGLTWEPGIWQMFLNLNFLFALYENRSKVNISLALLATLACFSTTGIIVSVATYLIHITLVTKRIKVSHILLPLIIFLSFSPFIVDNFAEKLTGRYMGSGMTRVSDFFTGVLLLYEHPIFGADHELATASNNPLIWALKASFWSGNYTDGAFDAYMTVPNSNGYIIFLLDWGLPLGLFFLIGVFRSRIISNGRLNIAMMAVILISMSAEAISRTSFFYFFILAAFFCFRRKGYLVQELESNRTVIPFWTSRKSRLTISAGT